MLEYKLIDIYNTNFSSLEISIGNSYDLQNNFKLGAFSIFLNVMIIYKIIYSKIDNKFCLIYI